MSEHSTGAQQDFAGQVIWITGASSGIGEELVCEFAARGAKIVLSARNEVELARVRDRAISDGADPGDLLLLPLDVIDYPAMPVAVKAVLDHFGRIDMLINNAGISQRSFCLDTELSVYRTMLEVNVLGQIALTKEVLPVMVRQGSGRMVITASLAGKLGAPLRTGYCAAKHAVMGFFDALRCEVAHQGVRVSTVTPGFIRTRISANALTGSGTATGAMDDDIADGMDAASCARVIVDGLAAGEEEIAVGEGPEMDLLALKRSNPEQVFRLMEGMASQLREAK